MRTRWIAVLLAAVFCTGGATWTDSKEDDADRIVVRIDPRVELMSIIFRLAGNPEYRRAPECAYVRDVDAHFGTFADHAVVRMAKLLRDSSGVSYDAVMSMAVHLEDVADLKKRVPFEPRPERLDARWSPEAARQFLTLARQFVEDSKFDEFIAARRGLYDESAARMRKKLAERRYMDWFDRFFGARPGARFFAVVGLLNGPNCYATEVRFPDGGEEIYQIMGVWHHDRRGIAVFGDDIVPTVVHEYCHAYVNPVVDRHRGALEPAGVTIFPQVQAAMERQAYGTWMTMMRESCVRACVVRYLLEADGRPAAQAEIDRQHRLEFLWTGELVELLGEYEAQRERYPTFDAFFPRVVKFFDAYAASHLDQLPTVTGFGPINRVIGECTSAPDAVIVLPDSIDDRALSKKMRAYVSSIHRRFYASAGVSLKNAAEVTEDACRTSALVLYGSPKSNRLLRNVIEQCGIIVAPDRIKIGGKVFEGKDLVLIACHPNPYNTDLPVLLYASAADQDVIELNSFFHGPTDYLVGRWGPGRQPETLHQGDFTRAPEGKWIVAD